MKLLDALSGKNTGRPPVWLMRQAGRYYPAYQAIRRKHSLLEMFRSPHLIEAVTRQPLALGVDAAILFSDITIIADALGLPLDFVEGKGPVVENRSFNPKPVAESLFYVKEAIESLKKDLTVPLIGFCGAPFTVARYLQKEPKDFDLITEVTRKYLKMQIEAGVDVIQIFDSWADRLSDSEFKKYSLKYMEKLMQDLPVPVILFCRGSSTRAKELAALNPAAISIDERRPLNEVLKEIPSHIGVQGNLDPKLLLTTPENVRKATQEMLVQTQGRPNYIANLGHGVLKDSPVECVEAFIQQVHQYE